MNFLNSRTKCFSYVVYICIFSAYFWHIRPYRLHMIAYFCTVRSEPVQLAHRLRFRALVVPIQQALHWQHWQIRVLYCQSQNLAAFACLPCESRPLAHLGPGPLAVSAWSESIPLAPLRTCALRCHDTIKGGLEAREVPPAWRPADRCEHARPWVWCHGLLVALYLSWLCWAHARCVRTYTRLERGCVSEFVCVLQLW